MDKLNFSRIPSIITLPELLAMQKTSMDEFLQWNVPPEKRERSGEESIAMRVVAAISVKGGISSCTVRALGPLPMMMSSRPDSMAG